MKFPSLLKLVERHQNRIVKEIVDCLNQLPWCAYQEYLLRTVEGKKRLRTWVRHVTQALRGDHEYFIQGEEQIGYHRANQGFELDFSYNIYRSFQQAVFTIINDNLFENKSNLLNYWDEIQDLSEILLKGRKAIAKSFLKTREEIISEQVTRLQEIYNYTRKIITIFDLNALVQHTQKTTTACFNVEKSLLFLSKDHQANENEEWVSLKTHKVKSLLKRTAQEGVPLFMDEAKNIHTHLDQSEAKLAIAIPIIFRNRLYGVLGLYNRKKGFKFSAKEQELLDQILYIMTVALENIFVLKDIEQSRHELHLLTGKMITIQEEERKRLSREIHDTLAQSLTGISYKIQFCQELCHRNSDQLNDQFDELIETVHHAIDQSRELISDLRPDLIDNLGLIPALKRLLNNFMEQQEIKVIADFPKQSQISSDINICLFRIVQEALMNIYKHAKADTVAVNLREENNQISLVVKDDGRGFDISKGFHWVKDSNKLGLLSMKERVEAVTGTLVIDSSMGQGCRIEATIPLL
ncbi:MAG: GAF domain-containing sensor histidine kinase [Deltaproteobacteria bacterium]|jgi:signal transduction histidine kinase|nr:GAF domain-containing sensor histidine kinase [Deltaproteobacteria bacterium]MBT4266835.1 GAF domain-containing sensor histidine kinase [Deltaproteobacteria bacterium]MBT4640850.1 GAF domain-containing sensor histidine kinase [Deltaproteobacteria bacterium]MBT6502371.1 GAF domain-containing sensor histidine kinase [Deltaproteobacteria bacterium]MBT6615814.1 GAF domain-containing sensor histidine kinase [Deltaproteobacteria bacterium]